MLSALRQGVRHCLCNSPVSINALAASSRLLPAIFTPLADLNAPITRTASTSKHPLKSSIVKYPFPIRYFEDKDVPVYNLHKQITGYHPLPGAVYNVPVRIDILHRVVRWQRAKRQQGTHKAKNRSEVRGGGRKPWPQKGSGRARQGSIRAPHWRGGGITHGPVPRSHAHSLPKKVRRLGLKCALSAKMHEGRLLVVQNLSPPEAKTRAMHQVLDTLLQGAPRRSVLLIDAEKSGADGGSELRLVTRNLPGVEVVPSIGANVYSILKRDYLVMTKHAVDLVTERLMTPINRQGMCMGNRLAIEAAAREAAEKRNAALAAGSEATVAKVAAVAN